MAIQKPPISRVFLTQLAVLIPISATAMWFDIACGYSLLLGGLIQLVPSIYFFGQAYRYQGARVMSLVATSFYKGEFGKLLLSAAGFATVFVFVKPLDVVALFSAYLAMTVFQFVFTVRALNAKSAKR